MLTCSLSHLTILSQLLILSQVDRVLDEVDWLIARKKSQTIFDKPGSGKKAFIFMHRSDESVELEGVISRSVVLKTCAGNVF